MYLCEMINKAHDFALLISGCLLYFIWYFIMLVDLFIPHLFTLYNNCLIQIQIHISNLNSQIFQIQTQTLISDFKTNLSKAMSTKIIIKPITMQMDPNPIIQMQGGVAP